VLLRIKSGEILKCVVLGSSGLVGSYVCDLLKPDFEVIPVSKSGSAAYSLDLTADGSIESLIAEEQPAIVINCVKGSMSTDEAEEKKEPTEALNLSIPLRLAKLQPVSKFRFIHISTDWVYEGKEGEVYSESSPTNPQNYYSYTKTLADEAIARICKDYVILRPECIFGLDRRKANIFSRLRAAMKEGRQSTFSQDQYSQPIYAKVLAEVIQKACKNKAQGIFNAVGPKYVSRYELALRFCDSFGWKKELVSGSLSGARKIKIPRYLKLDISKINREFFPMPSLEEQLAKLKQEESMYHD
jgi:dTDP-4-dehydrorhamnose reductase